MAWNKKETNKLVKLWKSGLKLREIAEKMNRSRNSVSSKINTLQQRGQLNYRNKRKTIKLTVKKQLPSLPPALKQYQKKVYRGYENNPMVKSQMKNMPPYQSKTAKKICKVIDECETLLLSKNKQYGDSALAPIRLFSKSDGQEQIRVRIDDKLNRLLQGDESIESDRDVIKDLVGYLILLLISMDDQ
tara:strand:+ start:2689 stop:3252 length:564 start_codon:yes stop_codon:yes gene_type:complete